MGVRNIIAGAGAVVGAFFGNPQLGFAIGSLIGNAVDPQRIRAPGLKELPVLGVTEGAYRQVAYGTTVIRDCQLIDWGDLEVKIVEEQQGKGGGPIVESERLYQTYAVAIGEPVAAIRYIKRNGVMVYDVRPGSTILDESAEFASRFRFYDGNETQLPDPDLEALPRNGVGNTPAYRGTSYFVMVRDDLTDSRGQIPTYEVETVGVGLPAPIVGGWFAGPVAENGAAGGVETFYVRAETAEALPLATPTPFPAEMLGSHTRMSVANGALFFHAATAAAVSTDGGASWTTCNSPLKLDRDVYWNGNFYYNGTQRSADGITWATTPNLPADTEYVVAKTYQNAIVAVVQPSLVTTISLAVSFDDGGNWTNYAPAHFGGLAIDYVKPGNLESYQFTTNTTRGSYTTDWFASWDYNDVDGAAGPGGNLSQGFYSNISNDVWIKKQRGLNLLARSTDGGNNFETAVLAIDYGTNPSPNVAWGNFVWAALRSGGGSPGEWYLNHSDEGGQAGSWDEVATPLYGNVESLIYLGDATSGTIAASTTTLEAIVADICDRCSIPAGKLNLAALTDEVRGVTLGGAYDGAGAITTLMPAFLFDLYEADRQLHAVKRGGAVKATITVDDLLEEPDENTLRGQGIEYPRSLQLKYLNPGQNYAAPATTVTNKTTSERVRGEVQIDLPVAFDETEALNVATRMLKVMWEDVNGEAVFSLPSGPFAWLTPTDCLGLVLRGATYRIRSEKVERSGGQLKVTARRDRQSATTSNLTAIPLPTPAPPPPSLAGVTTFVPMNIPGRVDADDQLGFVFGMTGLPGTAWQGANIAYRIAGGTDWTSLGNFTRRAVIGQLATSVAAASEFYTDTTNVLQVQLVGPDQLETITQVQFLSEGNPAAIVYSDGTAELVQFRDVVDEGSQGWSLSTLQRGRLATVAGAHPAGARFVMLAGTEFVPLPSSLIGQALQFRVTSIGTSPEVAPIYDFTWNPVHSQLEFAPVYLRLGRTGGNLTATWSPRHRFGTDVNPVASVNFQGYRVTATDGTTTTSTDVLFPEISMADVFTGPVTVSVQQLNRFTGPGPATSEVIA